jgi:NAD(P)-dependent dehydrogenase (short-subunit alcohol dehydrogenase family)
MADRMLGKVALISGGARGQGASHAKLLAAQGARVLIGDVLDGDGERTATELREEGLAVRYVHLDVTQVSDWESAVRVAESDYGTLDVLVNNAGIAGYAAAADCTDKEWTQTIAVNQTGVFYGMRAAIPCMRNGGGGSIVNTSSTFGLIGAPDTFAYQASKAAVLAMTRSAAVTYGTENIRVNALCPGVVDTPMLAQDIADWGVEPINALIDGQAIKRRGTPLDMSYAVLYLASDESSFVTGTELVVDGGFVAQ